MNTKYAKYPKTELPRRPFFARRLRRASTEARRREEERGSTTSAGPEEPAESAVVSRSQVEMRRRILFSSPPPSQRCRDFPGSAMPENTGNFVLGGFLRVSVTPAKRVVNRSSFSLRLRVLCDLLFKRPDLKHKAREVREAGSTVSPDWRRPDRGPLRNGALSPRLQDGTELSILRNIRSQTSLLLEGHT